MAPSATTALAVPHKAEIMQARAILEQQTGNLLKIMPAIVHANQRADKINRYISVFCSSLAKIENLAQCAPETMYSSFSRCVQYGLEPNGPMQEAWILPRWNGRKGCYEASFQIGYPGIMNLVRRAVPDIEFEMYPVYADDHFKYGLGLVPYCEHIPNPDVDGFGSVEKLIACYAVASFGGNKKPKFKVLMRPQLDIHRDRFAPKNKGGDVVGPWNSDFAAMGMKTALIALCKTLEKSVDLAEALDAEYDAPPLQIIQTESPRAALPAHHGLKEELKSAHPGSISTTPVQSNADASVHPTTPAATDPTPKTDTPPVGDAPKENPAAHVQKSGRSRKASTSTPAPQAAATAKPQVESATGAPESESQKQIEPASSDAAAQTGTTAAETPAPAAEQKSAVPDAGAIETVESDIDKVTSIGQGIFAILNKLNDKFYTRDKTIADNLQSIAGTNKPAIFEVEDQSGRTVITKLIDW